MNPGSPSSLSVQVKALEEQLGQQLFERRGRALHLTEAGRIALDYANTVLQSGHQLIEALNGLRPGRVMLRVGATATLSRNFQMGLLRPLLGKTDVELVIRSGVQADLLAQLDAHKLDLVLANHPAPADAETVFENTLLDEQPVSLVGHPSGTKKHFRFPQNLLAVPLVLPARGSAIRSTGWTFSEIAPDSAARERLHDAHPGDVLRERRGDGVTDRRRRDARQPRR